MFTFDSSTYTNTALTVIANSTTADLLYWARLEYDERLLSTETSNLNVLESSKVYLVLDGKDYQSYLTLKSHFLFFKYP